jgi:predicted metal-dependent HD superfamily phosphohydrolase
MLDEKRWNGLIERLTGNRTPDHSFRRLVAAYSEMHRYYHNISHIEHCLAEFDRVVNLCTSPDEVECAIWLHDVVYNPHAADNEEMSALRAKEILSESRCPEAKTLNIQELILATKHLQPPTIPDAQLIVDIDLSILGQPPDIFQKYEDSIRNEYSWVPDDEYRVGRSTVLHHFLDQPSVYSTERFQKMYEIQARKNLTTVLVALAQSLEEARR